MAAIEQVCISITDHPNILRSIGASLGQAITEERASEALRKALVLLFPSAFSVSCQLVITPQVAVSVGNLLQPDGDAGRCRVTLLHRDRSLAGVCIASRELVSSQVKRQGNGYNPLLDVEDLLQGLADPGARVLAAPLLYPVTRDGQQALAQATADGSTSAIRAILQRQESPGGGGLACVGSVTVAVGGGVAGNSAVMDRCKANLALLASVSAPHVLQGACRIVGNMAVLLGVLRLGQAFEYVPGHGVASLQLSAAAEDSVEQEQQPQPVAAERARDGASSRNSCKADDGEPAGRQDDEDEGNNTSALTTQAATELQLHQEDEDEGDNTSAPTTRSGTELQRRPRHPGMPGPGPAATAEVEVPQVAGSIAAPPSGSDRVLPLAPQSESPNPNPEMSTPSPRPCSMPMQGVTNASIGLPSAGASAAGAGGAPSSDSDLHCSTCDDDAYGERPGSCGDGGSLATDSQLPQAPAQEGGNMGDRHGSSSPVKEGSASTADKGASAAAAAGAAAAAAGRTFGGAPLADLAQEVAAGGLRQGRLQQYKSPMLEHVYHELLCIQSWKVSIMVGPVIYALMLYRLALTFPFDWATLHPWHLVLQASYTLPAMLCTLFTCRSAQVDELLSIIFFLMYRTFHAPLMVMWGLERAVADVQRKGLAVLVWLAFGAPMVTGNTINMRWCRWVLVLPITCASMLTRVPAALDLLDGVLPDVLASQPRYVQEVALYCIVLMTSFVVPLRTARAKDSASRAVFSGDLMRALREAGFANEVAGSAGEFAAAAGG